ncbi:MAG: 4-alpha-glucanotransferase, partial [Endomicrobia bacterium]|nr:4-alpha-glucanotransferase [Endomicrobiia bacterium]
MSQVYFLLCIHNHQPVGNFEHVIEEAYQKAYKPFIDIVRKYPEFKFALHCSGILWDYFIDKHQEYIEIVKELVKRGQVELISGGYYEPILSSIPQKDRIGQIKMANEFIYETFGVEPKGLWLT